MENLNEVSIDGLKIISEYNILPLGDQDNPYGFEVDIGELKYIVDRQKKKNYIPAGDLDLGDVIAQGVEFAVVTEVNPGSVKDYWYEATALAKGDEKGTKQLNYNPPLIVASLDGETYYVGQKPPFEKPRD